MFTGIVSEIGRIKSIIKRKGLYKIEVVCKKVNAGIAAGDSIAVNGVCLSVTAKNTGLSFDVVANTFNATNLKRLKKGNSVNLENALKLGDSIDGHIVSGHIDAERAVRKNQETFKGRALDIDVNGQDKRYIVSKGSIALDGVSLTIAEIYENFFRVYLIPHTLLNSALKEKKPGDYINIEFDMMAKYAEKKETANAISENTLRDKGFF